MALVLPVLTLYLFLVPQAAGLKPVGAEVLTATEQQALQSSSNIRDRAKVYLEAAGRRLQAADNFSRAQDATQMITSLQTYSQILGLCKAEVSQVSSKKREDLKKDELTLRRNLATLDTMEARLGAYDREQLRDAKQMTKELRFMFLGTFFGPGTLKPPLGATS